MKWFMQLSLSTLMLIFLQSCLQNVETTPVQFDSSEQQILYDLMVERCEAINARDTERLQNVYADQSTEFAWLKDRWLPSYERFRIKHYVNRVEKISVVGADAAGRFVLELTGKLWGRQPYPKVDVLYVKQDNGWRILLVSER